ncbi:MAG: glutathione S-transferase family protein [Alphaproteobacteria bacterium]|nr:glutathione S-transferase family protein [Alphaproteobacteria bacterium]MBU1514787.1 glutathione S-transferase family protein [Alphaproteobacteria bacterium]MBU2093918.1 glutathione S-transferase family protein [Alphaproteobacteria bacterium]MBU2153345.1 glutathione S-transferase family protein [Alphaproteobacteria bacterium]MBU2309773.1 glutathione S-transferase family protein [Alphaproteobacteria bacterium]
MITVYEHPLSPYAQKVKIALREKGLAFEVQQPGGMGPGGAAADFLAFSPRAEVPALIDGEVRVFDSTIILEYLDDAYPDRPMRPARPAERARVRMLEEVMDTHFEAINWGLSEIRWFGRAKGEQAEALTAAARQQTEGFYAWLETQLGDRDWFNGESFGWGDLSVAPYLNGSIGHGHPPPEGSRLAAWLARANTRPSVAKTTEESMTAARASAMPNVAELVEKGLFKREYRDHRLEWMIKSGGVDVVLKGLERDNIRFAPGFG